MFSTSMFSTTMFSTTSVCALALCLSSTLFGQIEGAQPAKAANRQPSIIIEVRDPSGQRVANADGWFRAEPQNRFTALPMGLPGNLLFAAPRTNELTAKSNDRGVLRFRNPAATAGSGMITTQAGLGALLPRIHSQRAHRITLHPLAEVTTKTGSETFVLVARATLPDGSKVTLPPQTGRKVRLPAGDYEVWASCVDGLIWQRVRLQPGARKELVFGGTAQRLQLAPNAYVHPTGMPDVSLRQLARDAGGDATVDGLVVLRGAALAAPLTSWFDGIVTPARVAPRPPLRKPLAWPQAADRLPRTTVFQLAETAPAQTTLLGLVRKHDRTFRVVAFANNDDGSLRMPTCPNGDAWLLLLAPDHAATARPWSTMRTGKRLQPPIGQPMTVKARDRGNLPIADLRVLFTPEAQDAATIVAHTDATGIARFGQVKGPGTLMISDARYANQSIELDLIPIGPLPLLVDAGETLTATATFADGAAGAGQTIVVTLRDPSGNLRPAQRTRIATAGKPFTFAGLPSEHNLLLTATAQRDGKTWSARRSVNLNEGNVQLSLRNEDPEFRPGKK